MKFEILRDNKAVMFCEDTDCIPEESDLAEMNKAEYKFRLNGKMVSLKRIRDFVKSS